MVLLCVAMAVAGCTTVNAIQIRQRDNFNHAVPPPKGWIYEAKRKTIEICSDGCRLD
jgi:hypothetical protein